MFYTGSFIVYFTLFQRKDERQFQKSLDTLPSHQIRYTMILSIVTMFSKSEKSRVLYNSRGVLPSYRLTVPRLSLTRT